jgi:TPR repeat protein
MKKSPVLALLLLFTPLPSRSADIPVLSPSAQPPSRRDRDLLLSERQDAERGNAKSMGELGMMYLEGVGCSPDPSLALVWLARGARKGDALSENNLGFLYDKGRGVPRDPRLALKWFQKAAAQGLASAQRNLGLLYGRGDGIPRDDAQALSWFERAARQNDLDSQINLAQMLSLGEGGPRDDVASYMWFCLALQHPSLEKNRLAELHDDIDWLEKRMPGKDVAEARKRARDWKPVYEMESSDQK